MYISHYAVHLKLTKCCVSIISQQHWTENKNKQKNNIPCCNALPTDNLLCTCYSLSDVIFQQSWKRGGEKWGQCSQKFHVNFRFSQLCSLRLRKEQLKLFFNSPFIWEYWEKLSPFDLILHEIKLFVFLLPKSLKALKLLTNMTEGSLFTGHCENKKHC